MAEQEAKGPCQPDETLVISYHPETQPALRLPEGYQRAGGSCCTGVPATLGQGHWDCISSLMKVTLPLLLAYCGQGREALGRRPEAEADPYPDFAPISKTLHIILAK